MRSVAVLLLALTCLTSNAFADGDDHLADAAKAHYERGQSLYAGGQFAEARAEFLAGFELSHKPAFLFNAAECARLMGQADTAREGYDKYLKLDPDGKLAMLAFQRLDELGWPVKPNEPSPSSPPPSPSLPLTPTPPPPVVHAAAVPPPTAIAIHRSNAPDESNAQLERYVGLGTAGLGVAMIVTGAFFGYKSSTLSNQVAGACTDGCIWSDVSDIDKYARTDATVQWWLYGLGAAAVVTGGALYWFGAHEHSPVVIAPTANGAAVSWSGRF